MKLSIIIPVYNSMIYLDRCLESCLCQDLLSSEYEIIAIDDGSTDDSLQILERYSDQYENVHCFSQPNGKQGAARNKGMEFAKGEYIWFVDSDDWIEENCLGRILENSEGADLCCMNAYFIVRDGQTSVCRREYLKTMNYDTRYSCFFGVEVPTYLFKRSFLQSNCISFLSGVYIEDNEYIPRCIYSCRSIQVIKDCIYYHLEREGSTMGSVNSVKCMSMLEVSRNLIKFIEKQSLSEEWISFFNRYIMSTMNLLLWDWKYLPKVDRKIVINSFAKEYYEVISYLKVFGKIGMLLKLNLIHKSPRFLRLVLLLESLLK